MHSDLGRQPVLLGRSLRLLGQILLLAALYFIAGRLSLRFAHYRENVTLLWPPTGLSLAALILFGRRLWPGVFIGALSVNLAGTPVGWFPSVGIAVGNTLEAWVGAALLTRISKFRPPFQRQQDVAAFLLLGVIGCTAISATIGVSTLLLSASIIGSNVWPIFTIWWLGDIGGALILTPVLLMWAHGNPPWISLARRFETWLALAILLVASSLAFSGLVPGRMGFAACAAPFPILVWTGTRLGPRGATVASFIIILVATLATASGSGPFVMGDATEAMILLWAYSMFVGLTAFTLAVVIEQRDAAEQRYRSGAAKRLLTEKERLLLLERERITREMHDGLGGQLVSVLSMVERGVSEPGEVAEALRRALDDVRIVVDSLDPNATDLPTSLGKLRARLAPLLRRNEIDLVWRIDDTLRLDAFSPEESLHLLRIIQEAVTNTIRHAHASGIEVKLTSDKGGEGLLCLTIRDDGCGLPIDTPSSGRGIQNMYARADTLGAVLRIEGLDPGTLIELIVAVPR